MTDTVTGLMKIAGVKEAESFGAYLTFEEAAAIYRAMLAASPQGEGSSADADTGELREEIARIIRDTIDCDYDGTVFGQNKAADAILDVIQSERGSL